MFSVTADEDRSTTTPAADNFRDLGGLATPDGRLVRRGRLFRSEYPHYLDDAGSAELNLRTAVDLRRDDEVAHETRPWQDWGVEWHQVSLNAGSMSSWVAGYHFYAVHCPADVARAVATLVRPGALPAMFFCAAGKDRTGIVAALLLTVLGVDRATVIEDYMRTIDGIGRVVGRLIHEAPYVEVLTTLGATELDPRPDLLEALLDWVDERGGARAWLLSQGVSAEDLDAFEAEILEPPRS